MKGMVLAAGFGTRFRPATYSIPKPMVPLCNRRLIDYPIATLLGAGVAELIVNLHHLPDQIRDYVEEQYGKRCTLQFSYEDEILGTGGAVRRVRWLLENDDSFFLMNGDTVQFPRLSGLEEARREKQALAALLLRHPPAGDRYTSVWSDEGIVTGFGDGRGERLMFGGAHSLSSRIFELLPDREFSGIAEDVYFPVAREEGGEKLAAMIYDGPWFDIGTPARYLDASHSVREMMLRGALDLPRGTTRNRAESSLVGEGSRIGGSVRESVIGGSCRVPGDADVQRSVLWDGVRIGPRAKIEDSILCEDVHLPPGSRLANVMVARRTEESYPDPVSAEGDLAWVAIDPAANVLMEPGRS